MNVVTVFFQISMDILVAQSISKKIKNRELLKNINFRLGKSECVGIIGDNGVGKTILLFILLGLIAPDYGELRYWGSLLQDQNIRKRINVIFANSRLFEELSPYDNIKIFANLYGMRLTDQEIDAYLERYDLSKYIHDSKTKMSQLSSGENSKIHLIKAFINSPEILFLDEPTSHLDTKTKKDFYSYFLEEKRKKMFSCIFISHSIKEINKLCDRVLILKDGKLKICIT